jgi:hypothetical protein
MWVQVAALDEDENYIGTLENDPVHNQVLSCRRYDSLSFPARDGGLDRKRSITSRCARRRPRYACSGYSVSASAAAGERGVSGHLH